MKLLNVLCVVSVLIGIGSLAMADNINPPRWADSERVVYGMWEFNSPPPAGADIKMVPADIWQTPSGSAPIAQVDHTWHDVFPDTSEYIDAYGQLGLDPQPRQGVWQLSGQILVELENYPEPLPEKWIHIQLTWLPDPLAANQPAEPSIDLFSIATSGGFPPTAPDLLGTVTTADGWFHSTYALTVQPNPPFETLVIFGDIKVDELVVYTKCVPEPASVMLMVGATGLLWRRRR